MGIRYKLHFAPDLGTFRVIYFAYMMGAVLPPGVVLPQVTLCVM